MRFFLTDLGKNHIILGYPWFAAFQPNINWARGWIDHAQLPLILRTSDATRARFLPKKLRRTTNEENLIIAHAMIHPSEAPPANDNPPDLPNHYRRHQKDFSKRTAQHFPEPCIWDHVIELKPNAPSSLPGKIYPLNLREQEELWTFVQQHLQKGYIRPSKSPYAAPFFFIKKKDGKLRPVQDYRELNKWTIRNRYPLPLIPQLINRVRDATLFTKFDIRWGYNNIRIKEGDEWKAAFLTNEGLFEPRVMFFGLTNSPATFQMMMNALFEEEIQQGWLTIYMDDMLIATNDNLALHRRRVHHVLDVLEDNDLYLKPEKCVFETRQVEFLGVVLKDKTVLMDPGKIKVVQNWPRPQTVKDVRSFLGFTGYYRYFIKNYSLIAQPLIQLTKKEEAWHWNEPQQNAFDTLKRLMCQQPVLRQPNYDKPFILQTDASAYGMGAILSQEGETKNSNNKPKTHHVLYYSAIFTPTERNYDIFERELLAVLKALAHWRVHLGWTRFPIQVLTDHTNLTYWKQPRKVNCCVARWFGELQDYWLEIKHIPGKTQPADMLSRPPTQDKGKSA